MQRAIRLAPGDADLHAFLSQAQFRLGQFDAAGQAITRAAELDPNNPEFHAGLGRILRRQGRLVRAVQSFQRATQLNPAHWAAADLHASRASVMETLQNWHLPMLADLVRNDAFEAAITRAVQPGDVVLDIGTGTGLLAMMAARAGAAHVYACEMEPNLADLATAVIARNGLADRITVIAQKSTELVSLPERATLLVTETFDSLLIGEGALASIDHARRLLLAPDARIIPGAGRLIGQLVSLPRLKAMHPLRRLNGFDMSPLVELGSERRLYAVVPSQEALVPLTEPVPLASFDFIQATPARQKGQTPTTYTASGPAQAVLLWIELDLYDEIRLSSAPGSPIRHWRPLAFVLDDTVTAEAGHAVSIHWSSDGVAMDFAVRP